MSRQSVGVVEFRDLHLDVRAQIVVTRMPERNLTALFLDQGGDCEIGLDIENTRLLRTFIQRAAAIPLTARPLWLLVGRAEFCWSDHSESGEDSGAVYVESNGAMARMIIQPNNGAWMPYVATVNFANLHELSTLLLRVINRE